MAAAPTTKDWRMLENHRADAGPHLLVSGLVHVPNTEHAPRLAEAKPGGNPKILLLDLTIAPSGQPGTAAPCWKQANFEKDVRHGQYGALDVRWNGKSVGKATVEDDAGFSARLARLTHEANAAHPVRTSRKPPRKTKTAAKKPAAKKPAAKKASAKKGPAKKGSAKKRPAKAAAAKKRTAPKKTAAKKAASKKPAARKKSARKTSARRKR